MGVPCPAIVKNFLEIYVVFVLECAHYEQAAAQIAQSRGGIELIVAYRFMAAGRVPAWPLVPCPYDLLIDCGDTIQRVQVKTAHDLATDTCSVRLTKRNTKGDRPIYVDAVDVICVVSSPNCIYVIPTTVIRSRRNPEIVVPRLQIGPTSRLLPYKNAFALGSGYGVGDEGTPPVLVKEGWNAPHRAHEHARGGIRRQRVTVEQVADIRRRLGDNWTAAQLDAIAREFQISTATVRNYLKGNRSDLRAY